MGGLPLCIHRKKGKKTGQESGLLYIKHGRGGAIGDKGDGPFDLA